jgi:hypothetical protein
MATRQLDTSRASEKARIAPAIVGNDKALSAGPAQLWDVVSGRTSDVGEFCRAWLGLQCGTIAGATAGLLLLRQQAQTTDGAPYVGGVAGCRPRSQSSHADRVTSG